MKHYHVGTEGWKWSLISICITAVLVTAAIVLKEVVL